MSTYRFRIVSTERAVLAEHDRHLADMPAVWCELVLLSWRVPEAGAHIEVSDEAGEMIIRVGIATARATAARTGAAA